MKRYWLSWPQPTEDYRPLTDPPDARVIGWWCSGYDSNDVALLCALVQGVSMNDAKSGIRKSWPEAPGRSRAWRIEEERPSTWLPGDRFPLSDWMVQRASASMTAPSGG